VIVREARLEEADLPPARGHLARAWSRLVRKKLAVIAVATLVVVYLVGMLAPVISPYGYAELDYSAFGTEAPSLEHLAGADRAGRDVLTRVFWGIQNTLVLTFISMVTGGLVIGVALGLISGYFGGRIDAVINRTGEVFSAFPEVLLMIIIAATLRPRLRLWVHWIEDNTFIDGLIQTGIVDYLVVTIALVSFSWFGMTRLVRGQVLVLKELQYVDAARALGASTSRILFVHLLPNAISPIVVTVSMGMGSMIGAEIILSWLGIGIQPPRPSLGRMLLDAGNLAALQQQWWLLLAPGGAAFLMVLAWNLLGDALSDVLNPRTR